MGRSKQNKGGKKDGDRYRKETKEERRERLRLQEESREKCLKLLPYAGGAIFFLLAVFALWVRSVPPKEKAPIIDPLTFKQGEGTPEFMSVNTEPKVKEGMDEAMENAAAETLNADAADPTDPAPAAEAPRASVEETIEL